MDFKSYHNNMPYPTSENFTVTWWYTRGKAVARKRDNGAIEFLNGGNTESMVGAVQEKIVDLEAFRAAVLRHREHGNELVGRFRQDLFEDLGIQDNPKRDLLFEKAWELGHSSGLQEVYSYAEDLVGLIR